MFELERQVLLSLPAPWGVDLSITNEVILVWASATVTFALLFFSGRRNGLVATGVFQNLFESLILLIDRVIVREGMGDEHRGWTPFLLTLFFFILISNLFGMLPAPTIVQPVTGNLNVSAGLALVVFAVVIVVNVRARGLLGFLKRFLPSGIPMWLSPFLVPIEIVSWIVRPISLAIRLFANMVAGHTLIFTFVTLEMTAAWYFKALPMIGALLMGLFELFVCFIQAFIFTMLAGVYIQDATEEAH